MKKTVRNLTEWKLWDILWGLFVFLMPLTSVPLIIRYVHSDVVAAPSALLLLPIVCLLGIQVLFEKSRISENLSPLILFVITSIIATLISFFRIIPEYKGADPFRASISAVITLFIGFCFYLAALLYHKDENKYRKTFMLINISGAIVCLWTFLQAFCWYRFHRYPEWMKDIQFNLSIGSLYRQRFVGFTLEPSWLAHQLNLLYLPFWFASSVTGYSAFRFRFKFFTLERILFAAGIVVLFLTLSRVGLAAFLLTVVFFMIIFVRRFVGKTAQKFPEHRKRLVSLLAYAGIFLAVAAAAYVILRLLMKLDFRMAGLFDIRAGGRSDSLYYIAEKLSLAARFVYWDGGISIFNKYPLLGVGLGHAGFYLPQVMNDYAFRLIEVRNLIYHTVTLLNIKSLWIRILAETGIAGFAFFFIWYLHSLFSGIVHLQAENTLKRTAAWMGCFALTAFILEGFSLDTFALPYLWFSAGLAAASGQSEK